MDEYKHIKVEDVEGVTIVRFLSKRILDRAEITEVGEDLDALKKSGRGKRVVFIFSDVEFLSSAALNLLMLFNRWAKANGASLRICELRPEILEVFTITRFDQFFDISDTKEEAIASFRI